MSHGELVAAYMHAHTEHWTTLNLAPTTKTNGKWNKIKI